MTLRSENVSLSALGGEGGERVRKWQGKGWTETQVCEEAHGETATVYRWENGGLQRWILTTLQFPAHVHLAHPSLLSQKETGEEIKHRGCKQWPVNV